MRSSYKYVKQEATLGDCRPGIDDLKLGLWGLISAPHGRHS